MSRAPHLLLALLLPLAAGPPASAAIEYVSERVTESIRQGHYGTDSIQSG